MSYHIYNTKGLVLSERPRREADRVYTILTRDLGLVRATALSVRNESSKLRGALEPVTLSLVSLVRGKEYWRTTSAESLRKISPSPTIMRPLALLEKLVQGEAPHPELFDAIVEKLDAHEHVTEQFEIKLVSQILFHLGYLKEEDLDLGKKDLIEAINRGIEVSHL